MLDLSLNELDLLISHALRQRDDFKRELGKPLPPRGGKTLRKATEAGLKVWLDLLAKLTAERERRVAQIEAATRLEDEYEEHAASGGHPEG